MAAGFSLKKNRIEDFENEMILISCLYYYPSRLSKQQFSYLVDLVNMDYFSLLIKH